MACWQFLLNISLHFGSKVKKLYKPNIQGQNFDAIHYFQRGRVWEDADKISSSDCRRFHAKHYYCAGQPINVIHASFLIVNPLIYKHTMRVWNLKIFFQRPCWWGGLRRCFQNACLPPGTGSVSAGSTASTACLTSTCRRTWCYRSSSTGGRSYHTQSIKWAVGAANKRKRKKMFVSCENTAHSF